MNDPVINEFGFSYERDKYVPYIAHKKKDPKTGQEIKSGILYTNITLQKAIDHFLEE